MVQGRILKFQTPFRKFGTGEARNFKFGTQIDFGKIHLADDKIPIGAWSVSRGRIFRVWDFLYILGRANLGTSNFRNICHVVSTS